MGRVLAVRLFGTGNPGDNTPPASVSVAKIIDEAVSISVDIMNNSFQLSGATNGILWLLRHFVSGSSPTPTSISDVRELLQLSLSAGIS
jgi:hypothetical protein